MVRKETQFLFTKVHTKVLKVSCNSRYNLQPTNNYSVP